MDNSDTGYLTKVGRSLAWHLPNLPIEEIAKRRSAKALALDLCSGTPEIIPALTSVLENYNLWEISSTESDLSRKLKIDAIVDSLRESYSSNAVEATKVILSTTIDSLVNLGLGTIWHESDIQRLFDRISSWNGGSIPASPRALREKFDDSFDPLVAAVLHIPLVWINIGLDTDDEKKADISFQLGFLMGFIVESVLRRRQKVWKGNRQLLAYYSKIYEAKSLLSEAGASTLQSCFTEEGLEEVILPCEFLIELNLFDSDSSDRADAVIEHSSQVILDALLALLEGDLPKAKQCFKGDTFDVQKHIRESYYRDIIESKDYWLHD